MSGRDVGRRPKRYWMGCCDGSGYVVTGCPDHEIAGAVCIEVNYTDLNDTRQTAFSRVTPHEARELVEILAAATDHVTSA